MSDVMWLSYSWWAVKFSGFKLFTLDKCRYKYAVIYYVYLVLRQRYIQRVGLWPLYSLFYWTNKNLVPLNYKRMIFFRLSRWGHAHVHNFVFNCKQPKMILYKIFCPLKKSVYSHFDMLGPLMLALFEIRFFPVTLYNIILCCFLYLLLY